MKTTIDLLIHGGHVVTVDSQGQELRDGALAIHEGKIIDVGSSETVLRKYEARQIINAQRKVVMPGLINAHTHAPMSLFRGIANDLMLMDWLQKYIFPAEAKNVNDHFVRVGTRLACLEMLRGGTTTFVDMYYFEDSMAEETEKSGMRAILGQSVLDFPAPDNKTWDSMMASVEKFGRRWKNHSRIVPAMAPHAPYTVSKPHLVEAYKLAQELKLPYVTHLTEDLSETQTLKEKYGLTPVRYLHELGVLGPSTIAAHVIWLDEQEMSILAETKTGVVHNPESNLKLAAGISPVPQMLKKGVRIGLGTDGAASNNDLDIWSEMNFAAKIHKVNSKNPTVVSAREALEMATRRGAEAIHMDHLIGSLEVGKRADVILIDFDQPHLTPVYDVISHLVYAVKASDVQTVIVEGQIVMLDKKVLTLNIEEILSDSRDIASDVMKSLEH